MRGLAFPRAGSALLVAGLVGVAWAGETPKTPEGGGAKPALQWVAYGEALERAAKEDKHVLIDFYTTWCGWCKVMDSKTYTDPTVVGLLNQHFLIAKINAESGRKFPVKDTQISGQELAAQFGVRSFPMTSFLMPDGTKIANLPGYIPAEKFTKVLEFVHTRGYLKEPDAETTEPPAPAKPKD